MLASISPIGVIAVMLIVEMAWLRRLGRCPSQIALAIAEVAIASSRGVIRRVSVGRYAVSGSSLSPARSRQSRNRDASRSATLAPSSTNGVMRADDAITRLSFVNLLRDKGFHGVSRCHGVVLSPLESNLGHFPSVHEGSQVHGERLIYSARQARQRALRPVYSHGSSP